MELLLSGLLLSAALQLCSSAPALQPLTCTEMVGHVADMATRHINEQHRHGYKFKSSNLISVGMAGEDKACNMKADLGLVETTCPTISPKDFTECGERQQGERRVVANCTVNLSVMDGTAKIHRYNCVTQQEMTNEEMVSICPDCPTMIALNDSEGLKSIHEAVKDFNKNTSNQNIFVLQDVGRILLTYIMSTGMNYFSEFTLVETLCPREARIVPEACRPKCPDRAKHAFCNASYSSMNGLYSVECELYPAKNTTPPGPCEGLSCSLPPRPPPHVHVLVPPPHVHVLVPPSHSHDQGPPKHSDDRGPPKHSDDRGPPKHSDDRGPPPHSHGRGDPPHSHGRGDPPHSHGRGGPPHCHDQSPIGPIGPQPLPRPHCLGLQGLADPAIHPICPWSRPPM